MNGESCILYNKEVIMIKELIRLSNHLDAKGLSKEADYLDAAIGKIAEPKDSGPSTQVTNPAAERLKISVTDWLSQEAAVRNWAESNRRVISRERHMSEVTEDILAQLFPKGIDINNIDGGINALVIAMRRYLAIEKQLRHVAELSRISLNRRAEKLYKDATWLAVGNRLRKDLASYLEKTRGWSVGRADI